MPSELLAANPDCEIVSSRIVTAPIHIVFTAWSNPEHLKNWWGPAGFTNTFNEFDFRPGGKWSFIMHGPDKGNYHNDCEFIKIEKPFQISWKRHSKPLFQVLFTFEEISISKTKVVFKMIFDTPEECNKLRAYVPQKNEENFDRLEIELAQMS